MWGGLARHNGALAVDMARRFINILSDSAAPYLIADRAEVRALSGRPCPCPQDPISHHTVLTDPARLTPPHPTSPRPVPLRPAPPRPDDESVE